MNLITNLLKLTGLIFLSLILAGIYMGSGDKQGPLPMPVFSAKPETRQLLNDSWPSLLVHCPGLSKYQKDLSYVGVDDLLDPSLGELARAAVVYKVADNPAAIPRRYMAAGHTCGFGVGKGGTLRIQKRPCVSICLDSDYESGGADYVVPLNH